MVTGLGPADEEKVRNNVSWRINKMTYISYGHNNLFIKCLGYS